MLYILTAMAATSVGFVLGAMFAAGRGLDEQDIWDGKD